MGIKVTWEGQRKLRKEENVFTQGTSLSHAGWDWKSGNSKVLFKDERPLEDTCTEHWRVNPECDLSR
jgi:hypothetical protein